MVLITDVWKKERKKEKEKPECEGLDDCKIDLATEFEEESKTEL